MIVLAFLIVSAVTPPLEPASESPRCSIQVRFGGPSPDVMYVHAVATGTRTMVAVDEGIAVRNEVLPDSAVAFEFRVIQAMGGPEPPAPGDVIMVTPWDYGADCSRRAWDGPWIETDEETALTVRGRTLQGDGSHFHVLGGHAAYPQGWWHAVRGRTYPARGPGENRMSPRQFFHLLEALPSLDGLHPNDLRDAHERVIGVLRSGPGATSGSSATPDSLGAIGLWLPHWIGCYQKGSDRVEESNPFLVLMRPTGGDHTLEADTIGTRELNL